MRARVTITLEDDGTLTVSGRTPGASEPLTELALMLVLGSVAHELEPADLTGPIRPMELALGLAATVRAVHQGSESVDLPPHPERSKRGRLDTPEAKAAK